MISTRPRSPTTSERTTLDGLVAGRDDRAAATLGLVARAQAGDEAAFEELIGARLSRLLRLAMSITCHDADAGDAVQNSCLRAWLELPRLRDPSRFDAWLWRIVINACRSSMRGRRRTSVREIAIDGVTAAIDGPSHDGSPGDLVPDRDLISRAFRRLSIEQRTILVLHHVEGRPIDDIAELLATREGTVKSRLHAAREALERALTAEQR